MALTLQRLSNGGVRVVPAGAQTRRVRALAAGMGATGISQRGRVGEGRPGHGLSFGGVLRGVGKAVGTIFTTATGIPRPSAPTISPAQPFAPVSRGCSPGFRKDAAGNCVKEGFVGTIERFLPGGDTGTMADVAGEAVIGAFGIPARQPMQVGTVTRNDGGVSPILRCGPRMVLGFDNLCYPKALLGPRSRFRKHKRPVKPPVTGGDMKAIRRAARTQDRVKELAKDVGLATMRPKKKK